MRIVYEGALAQALALWYGHENWRPVQPVASSRRVGMVAAPVAPGDVEIPLGGSGTGRPQVIVSPGAVAEPGLITLTTMTEGPALDAHRSFGTPAVQYDLSVSADLSGATSVCFTYEDGRFSDERTVQLLHYEGGAWVRPRRSTLRSRPGPWAWSWVITSRRWYTPVCPVMSEATSSPASWDPASTVRNR